MTRLRIKVCGLTREGDVEMAGEADVDSVGFVLWHGSPRAVSLARATELARRLPPSVTPVGVMVRPALADAAAAVGAIQLGALQLHGVADPTPFLTLGVPVIWVAALTPMATPKVPRGTTLMLDAHDPERHGGTGRTTDWSRAADIARTTRLVLAGGLTPENIADAVARVRPYGVDVSSGVELSPGIKCADRIRRFVEAARRPFAEPLS